MVTTISDRLMRSGHNVVILSTNVFYYFNFLISPHPLPYPRSLFKITPHKGGRENGIVLVESENTFTQVGNLRIVLHTRLAGTSHQEESLPHLYIPQEGRCRMTKNNLSFPTFFYQDFFSPFFGMDPCLRPNLFRQGQRPQGRQIRMGRAGWFSLGGKPLHGNLISFHFFYEPLPG
jgi:hypothetical protein